ncbi:MAG: hypothetical protein OEZ31_06240 [Nitrospirota bacterium]|nr:hypothetical protein [Nitrospirota bacterium]
MNNLILFLSEFRQKHLLGEKIFVVPSYQVGHQIGKSLTKAGHSWVNLRFATLPSLAQAYAGLDISQEDVSQNLLPVLGRDHQTTHQGGSPVFHLHQQMGRSQMELVAKA